MRAHDTRKHAQTLAHRVHIRWMLRTEGVCIRTYMHTCRRTCTYTDIHTHTYTHVYGYKRRHTVHTCRELAEAELKVATAGRDVAKAKLEVLKANDAQRPQVASAER